MKKRWRAAALGLCAVMAICGCSAQPKDEEIKETTEEKKEETPEEAAEKAKQAKLNLIEPTAYGNVDGLDLEPGTYFSIIGKGSSETYWKTIKEGAEAAVAELNEKLGYEGSDKIKFVYSGPSESDDVDAQVSILDEELDRYPSALGISVIDSQSCEVQFDLATMNGIPLVSFDSKGNYQGVMASVMTDNAKASTSVALHMADEMGETGEVLVVAHDSKSQTSKDRVNYFVKELQEKHTGVTVAGTYYLDQIDEVKREMAEEELGLKSAEGDVIEEEQLTPEQDSALHEAMDKITVDDVCSYLLKKHPNVKGIFATNSATTMRMVNVCEENEMEGMTIMGYDADADAVKALEEGKIAGMIVQNPYGMGYAVIVAEARCVLGLGNEADIDTGYTWVTPGNIKDKATQRILYAE